MLTLWYLQAPMPRRRKRSAGTTTQTPNPSHRPLPRSALVSKRQLLVRNLRETSLAGPTISSPSRTVNQATMLSAALPVATQAVLRRRARPPMPKQMKVTKTGSRLIALLAQRFETESSRSPVDMSPRLKFTVPKWPVGYSRRPFVSGVRLLLGSLAFGSRHTSFPLSFRFSMLSD